MPNIRDIVGDAVKNHAMLRDSYIDKAGQDVTVRKYNRIERDIYGERKPVESTDRNEYNTKMLFDWSEHRMLLGFADESEEATIPLEASAKLSDEYLVEGAKVTIDAKGVGDADVVQEYTITKSIVKRSEGVVERRITLLPHRGGTSY